MKKFEQFDLFKKKNNVDYHESDPITLNEIVNKHGGINNLRFLEVLTELNDTFKNKKVKLIGFHGLDEIYVNEVRLEIKKNGDGSNTTSFNFFINNGFITIGANTPMIIKTKRKISESDPFGEESW